MRLVRLAIANVNSTVGATRANTDRCIELALRAAAEGATVVAFPEQVICGYAPEDLVQWRAFVSSQWGELLRFADATKGTAPAYVLGLTVARGAHVYNSAALVHRGVVHGVVPKEKLPTYNVFYEARTFARGRAGLVDEVHGVPFGDLVFDLDFGTMALEVCEDIWSPDGPMRRRSYAGAELVVNVSASPYRLGVVATRREMISTRAGDNQVTVLYSALVGANDGLIFDGGGYVAQNGRVVLEAPRYVAGLSAVTVDLDRTARLRTENTTWRHDQEEFEDDAPRVRHVPVPGSTGDRGGLVYPAPNHASFFLPPPEGARRSARAEFCEDLLDALALGVGDYFEKTGAFKTIGVALSGGRDSLLCLLVARRYVERRWAALPPEERKKKAREILRAIFMPTRYSSKETHLAAERAAAELDAPFVSVSIDDAFARELAEIEKMLQPGEAITALAKQNVQARIRAERMWTWANSAGALFLQTSNMSEKAVGYATIGGDMEGALSVIANVPKTVVNYLLDYLLETTGSEGIRLTLVKPASAELADDQEDEKDLMPFPVLDACFALYAGEKMSPAEVKLALAAMFPAEAPERLAAWTDKFARLFTQSIYKWVQTPLCLHVGNLDLDRERALQLPVVQRSEWQSSRGG
ncbi:MAG: NAD(+) synthase [Myxococcales bacterium]|jgi:NAD+ synthase (glutamine-hydrolysing)|nr:NAD(+) synthase [Myxococcales bacterium]